jgi:hypothetical protein
MVFGRINFPKNHVFFLEDTGISTTRQESGQQETVLNMSDIKILKKLP